MEEMDTKVLLDMVNADMDMMEAVELIPGKNTNRKLREIIFAHQNGKLASLVAPFMDKTKRTADVDIQPNREFDNQKTPVKEAEPAPGTGSNKYGIEVSEFDKNEEREFSTYKQLFNKLMGITPQITTPRYWELAEKLGFNKKYPDKEAFLKYATKSEIDLLLNAN
jgi:hypothetical protein